MNKSIYLIIFTIFTVTSLSGQNSTNPDSYIDLYYESISDKFKKKTSYSKLVPIETDKVFRKANVSKTQMDELLDLIEQNGEAKIEEERFAKLSAKFNTDTDLFTNRYMFHFKFISGYILNKKNEKTLLEGSTFSLPGYINTNQKFDPQTGKTTYSASISCKNFIGNYTDVSGNGPGEGIFKPQFVIDYNIVKVSKKDIGKTILLFDEPYKVIGLFDNKLILDNTDDRLAKLSGLSWMVILPEHPSKEMLGLNRKELKEKNIILDRSERMKYSSYQIPQKIYDVFFKNPKYSLTDFRKKYPFEKLKKIQKENHYIILSAETAIEGEIWLYHPIYYSREMTFKF